MLANVDDPEGMIPLTVGLLDTIGGQGSAVASAHLIVNGKMVVTSTSALDMATTNYPFLFFGTPATGSAAAYETNLVQMTRFTSDFASGSTFANGTISTATHSLGYGMDPGTTFLENWSKLATREGWYWRYTPQPYVVGTRTLGKVDFAADPGTDRTASVIFDRADGTLVDLALSANADNAASGTATLAQSSPDGAGIGFWRDINTMTKYGVIDDMSLAFTAADFNTARRAAYQIVSNKINLGTSGSKTITILRDPQTADVWRELDRVTINDPETGIYRRSARIIGYTFDEGQPTQTLMLDQFSADDLNLPWPSAFRAKHVSKRPSSIAPRAQVAAAA